MAPLTESTFYILLALLEPRHGWAVMNLVAELSSGRVKLAPGTLYGAFTALSEKGWIIQLPSSDGERKKDYVITEKGRKVLEGERTRLRELLVNADKYLGGNEDE